VAWGKTKNLCNEVPQERTLLATTVLQKKIDVYSSDLGGEADLAGPRSPYKDDQNTRGSSLSQELRGAHREESFGRGHDPGPGRQGVPFL